MLTSDDLVADGVALRSRVWPGMPPLIAVCSFILLLSSCNCGACLRKCWRLNSLIRSPAELPDGLLRTPG